MLLAYHRHAIKSDPYFAALDFDKLSRQTPPAPGAASFRGGRSFRGRKTSTTSRPSVGPVILQALQSSSFQQGSSKKLGYAARLKVPSMPNVPSFSLPGKSSKNKGAGKKAAKQAGAGQAQPPPPSQQAAPSEEGGEGNFV